MIKYKKQKIETEIVEKVTCDVCKKSYNIKKDAIEIQEFHNIAFTGGYDSVFGDGASVRVDICQHCLKKMIGEYLQK